MLPGGLAYKPVSPPEAEHGGSQEHGEGTAALSYGVPPSRST